jgi:hypothetical protein
MVQCSAAPLAQEAHRGIHTSAIDNHDEGARVRQAGFDAFLAWLNQ